MSDPAPAPASGAGACRRPARGGADVAALERALAGVLGAGAVSADPAERRAASTDWAHLSPVLAARLPAGTADLVAHPGDPAELAATVALAHRHRVPVTVRGKGTGNYGQSIPLRDGLVVDTGRCDRVRTVGEGWVHAEPGATFVALEAAARRSGQELALVPSTVGSTVGGFLAGGAGGTGSLANGAVWDGFVHALEAVPCTDEAAAVTLEGADCLPMLHAYGVTGVIAGVTVALRPRRDWTALFASFPADGYPGATAAALAVAALDPVPRLLSLDEPGIVAAYPVDPGMPRGRHSLRAVVDASTVAAASALVTGLGGTVEEVRPKGVPLLTSLSFNHTTYRVLRARPGMCHLQAGGRVLVEDLDAVRAVAPGLLLHLDGFRTPAGVVLAGMLMVPFAGPDALAATVDDLRAIGVDVDVSPHTWDLHRFLDRIRPAAARFDPDGLLNPGKLPPP
ncbi:MAG: FAD-binding oxidoreductase [Kineosporiaceae bacterium]